jgi:surfactin synthase thioesterase subunit|tara:strand:+ start:38 stop:256 length:219 start_codon:yes stop_codon:yes gene_type:complete
MKSDEKESKSEGTSLKKLCTPTIFAGAISLGGVVSFEILKAVTKFVVSKVFKFAYKKVKEENEEKEEKDESN